MSQARSGITPNLQFETISPATKLLEKRRKMYEIHEEYENQKKEYQKQEELFQKQEDEICQRDLKIQGYLISFCNLLSDSDAKKQRAERRYNEEKKAREQKQREIKEISQQIEELQELQQRKEKKVGALKKYEEYLETVTKAYPDQYQDLSEILTRHKTLVDSIELLQNLNKEKSHDLDQLKTEMFNYEKSKNHEILQLSNEIKELTQKLEVRENQRISLQQTVEQNAKTTSDTNLNLGKILLAIDNLYTRCNAEKVSKVSKNVEEQDGKEKKNGQDKQKEQYNEQDEDNYTKKGIEAVEKLKQIKQYMNDFRKINEDCYQLKQKQLKAENNKK